MKIYIVGCAKSGTTLVRRLFNAFDLKVYNYDEIRYDKFVKSDYEVGKRRKRTVFSYDLPEKEIQNQLKALRGIKIVFVVRRMEDVCRGGRVSKSRWESCMNQLNKYGVDYVIEYDSLILNPDSWQNHISNSFGLEIIHKWSDYPEFVDISEERETTNKGSYKLRPIGAEYD